MSTPAVARCYDGHAYSGGGCSGSSIIGQIDRLSGYGSTDSETAFSYDARGRVTASTQTTGGVARSFGYTYNLDDTLATQTYPTGKTFTFRYDSAGRATDVSGGGDTYVSSVTYAAHGAPSQVSLGNGIVENTSFNNRLQPCTISAGSHLTLSFAYGTGQPGCGDYSDNNGNIREQQVAGPGVTPFSQTYDYDGVNRLLAVSETTTSWSRVYSYDRFGNRALSGVGAGAAVGIGQPGSLGDFDAGTNRLTAAWAGYDDGGNLAHFKFPGNSALDWTAAYDGDNKQRWFCKDDSAPCAQANADAEYRYDGQGNRVRKILAPASANPPTTTYVYDAFGKLAAEYSTAPPTSEGGRFYRTTDHLGSTRLVTDADGECHVWQDFYPFGERILSNSSTGRNGSSCYGGGGTGPFTQEFTGKERDEESGLDHFGARYLSASLGRFTSADAPFAGQWPQDPQSWNMYGYGANSPLVFHDPTGRAAVRKIVGAAMVKLYKRQLRNARQRGVDRAWAAERRMVRETGAGTRKWESHEITELLETGRVKDYVGHHINSVAHNTIDMAENPANIKFVRAADHVPVEHGGNTHIPTSGPLIDRSIPGVIIGNLDRVARINDEQTIPLISDRDSLASWINPINNVVETAELITALVLTAVPLEVPVLPPPPPPPPPSVPQATQEGAP